MRRNVDEWVDDAHSAREPADVQRCLEQAFASIRSCNEGRRLLQACLALRPASAGWVAQVADRTLELALREREVWGVRDAAAARASALMDRAGALAALDAGRHTFQQPRADLLGRLSAEGGNTTSTRGYEWVLLGRGYVETLDDRDGLRACLETGLGWARSARNADDLCAIASAWGEWLDLGEGQKLLQEAGALAAGGASTAWALANAWRKLGDDAAAKRVLDAALHAAENAAAALHIFRAWRSIQDTQAAQAALQRARTLASDVEAWLQVAEAIYDHELSNAELHHAIQQAERLACDEPQRGRVARAYWLWLGDAAGSARVGPRGLAPADMRRAARTLEGWESSASDLFDWLRERATEPLLQRIAAADYGMDAGKHYAALQDICNTGLIPRPMGWEPHEVLALTRWSQPPNLDHMARALSCALLCISPSDLDELIVNGPILAESCQALGGDAQARAERLFAWLAISDAPAPQRNPSYQDPEPFTALFLLLLSRAAEAPDDARLDTLAQALLDPPYHSLLELRIEMDESMRADLWHELCRAWLVPAALRRPALARVLEELDMAELLRAEGAG